MNETAIHVKAGIKLSLFFLVLVISILTLCFRLIFTRPSQKQKIKFLARKKFCKKANRIFGIQLIVKGELPPEDCYLYISNHRSFYDPVAFLSHLTANPVSKSEVSRYPVIGWGTRLTEVLMLDRTEKEERRKMKHQIYECLLNGTSILVYPEGTTSSAPLTGSFKKGAFESTVKAGRSVIPVAMEYPHKGYYWIEKSLYQQFLYQVINPHDRRIYLSIGSPVSDADPMKLLKKTQDCIDKQIKELRKIREALV